MVGQECLAWALWPSWPWMYRLIQPYPKIYFQDFRFISAPTMPDKEERKSRLLVLLSASIGGLIFMAIFSLFASWWGQSKSFVTTDHKEFEAIG